jgi:hypothetical protein
MLRERVLRLVAFSSRRPYLVLFTALLIMLGCLALGRRLDVRSDLLELLPRESAGFRAFEHQLGRVGGGATLIVIVESSDKAQNERFVDELAADLAARPDPRVRYVESGTKDVRAFYERNKWLYATLRDLQDADETLDHQIALSSGLVSDLEAPDDDALPAAQATTVRPDGAPRQNAPSPEKKHALGMDEFDARWNSKADELDKFPSGYFESEDGHLVGLRMVSSTNLGDVRGDSLLAEVDSRVQRLRAQGFSTDMHVGYTGDVASASDEKKALVSDAVWATSLALVVLVVAIVLYYRSLFAPLVVALPAFFGVAAAYAFAELAFGYINTSGAFLGAIILGNGINYPIVLLSRYKEFRAQGMEPDVARSQAVWNAFRAELVGACVAAIAYGSLLVTQFRGFSQFGAIGFFGMFFVWASIIPLVPALVVLVERWQAKLPRVLRDRPARVRADGSRSAAISFLARATERYPWAFIGLALVLTAAACAKVPGYVRDPWEYDFGKLGSKSSETHGAGEWSNKANVVFGGKMNIAGALMLADTPEQVPLLTQAIKENDARDPQGTMIAEITTIDDYLPGAARDQEQKLAVLSSIRERLSPRVLGDAAPEERKTLLRMRPPEYLRALDAHDLPPLLARRFTENDGRVGTILYVKPKNDVVFADAHNHLRLSATTDNVRLPSGITVMTASRSTIFAEMLRSMRRDGPLASLVALALVLVTVRAASRGMRQFAVVVVSLLMSVTWLLGFAAWFDFRVNYVNFIALPITLGIGCEYPFNLADRTRLLGWDAPMAVRRSAGAVMLCSFTTITGYGSLILSDFQALASFGELAVVGEVACIFSAVFVVPALFCVLGARPPSRGAAPTGRSSRSGTEPHRHTRDPGLCEQRSGSEECPTRVQAQRPCSGSP